MHNMALRLQPAQATLLHQPTPLRQPLALLEDMPVEPTVALLVRTIALRLALPLRLCRRYGFHPWLWWAALCRYSWIVCRKLCPAE